MGVHFQKQEANPFVFVAHKSDDKERIRPIVDALLRFGFWVWIDSPHAFSPPLHHDHVRHLEPGESYRLTIPEYIRNAGCVLAVWSKTAIESAHVLSEASMAHELGKLVPVTIDGAMPPLDLRYMHILSLVEALSTRELSLDGAFGAVVDAINRNISEKQRLAWERYDGLVRGAYQIAFVPLLNRKEPMRVKYKSNDIDVYRDPAKYNLPKEFRRRKSGDVQLEYDTECCRLVQWGSTESRLELTFTSVKYSQYLASSELLDSPMPGQRELTTFREAFARTIPGPDDNLRDFPLTNISGVGVFIVTNDHPKRVLITRLPADSHVYPTRWTFSASGAMRWGASPNLFTEVLWKTRQKIRHQIDLARLELVELGVDARKLYFEFCFVEHAHVGESELREGLKHLSARDFEFVPLNPPTEIPERVTTRCWEPAAEAALLSLAMAEHGVERTLGVLEKRGSWRHHKMMDEWDFRASRRGDLAVMSVRYPQDQLERQSRNYVDGVVAFAGHEIEGKTVLEVGSGIGRITRELARVCKAVTCVDLCERMNQRNEESLGALKKRVNVRKGFVQAFEPDQKFDAVICSLVLIHNVEQIDFEKAVEVMCRCADAVFVFEDVTSNRPTSRHTQLLSEQALSAAFATHGFALERSSRYDLFGDVISFMKYVRAPSADE